MNKRGEKNKREKEREREREREKDDDSVGGMWMSGNGSAGGIRRMDLERRITDESIIQRWKYSVQSSQDVKK